MKCSKCGEYRTTIEELRSCAGCNDGTVQQLAAHDGDELIEAATKSVPGLANRFTNHQEPEHPKVTAANADLAAAGEQISTLQTDLAADRLDRAFGKLATLAPAVAMIPDDPETQADQIAAALQPDPPAST